MLDCALDWSYFFKHPEEYCKIQVLPYSNNWKHPGYTSEDFGVFKAIIIKGVHQFHQDYNLRRVGKFHYGYLTWAFEDHFGETLDKDYYYLKGFCKILNWAMQVGIESINGWDAGM